MNLVLVEHQEGAPQQRPVDDVAAGPGPAHRARVGWLGSQREGGQHVGYRDWL